MATTGVNFVLQNKVTTSLDGAAILTAPYLVALERQSALVITGRVPGGAAGFGALLAGGIQNNGNYLIDTIMTDLARQGFAKNGAFHVTTSGTTPVNVDLTNLATNSTTHVGDVTFATANMLIVYVVGGGDMTIAPGGSNPSRIPTFTGTTPTMTVPLGSPFVIGSAAGLAVDSTHKILTITPTAGGDVVIAVGGA